MIWIEVFSAGCSMCQNAVALVEELAGDDNVTVHDMKNPAALLQIPRKQKRRPLGAARSPLPPVTFDSSPSEPPRVGYRS